METFKRIRIAAMAVVLAMLAPVAVSESFALDPMIDNQGPIVRLATSDLPKAPLIITRGNQIDWSNPGLRIEQLRIVAELLNIRFSYARLPWVRALKLAELGMADAVFVTGYTEERSAWGAYPLLKKGQPDTQRAISKINYWLYSRRDDNIAWDGVTLDVGGGTIGASTGDMMTKRLRKEGYNVFASRSNEQLLKMLANKRTDAVVCFRNLCDKIIDAAPEAFSNLERHSQPFRPSVGYLVFAKAYYAEHPQRVEEIWGAFKALWEDGTMENLFVKWGWR